MHIFAPQNEKTENVLRQPPLRQIDREFSVWYNQGNKSEFDKEGLESMEIRKLIESDYDKSGDYYLPNLVLEDTEVQPIGKYGRMRKHYLKEHRPALYSSLLLTGKMDRHLAEIDETCEERMELLIQQIAKREGVTKALKAADQMKWVRRMNSIRNRAEEIVLSELVYC